MDIIVEESYVIPLSILRRFVAGSPRGHVSLCGDVVGPSFPYGVSGLTAGVVMVVKVSSLCAAFSLLGCLPLLKHNFRWYSIALTFPCSIPSQCPSICICIFACILHPSFLQELSYKNTIWRDVNNMANLPFVLFVFCFYLFSLGFFLSFLFLQSHALITACICITGSS